MNLRSYVLMGLSLAVLGAASTQAQIPPGRDLMQHEWRLDSMTGGSTSLRARPTLTFGAASRLSGFTGCNRISGTWSLNGDQLSLNRMSPTRRDCSHTRTIQESRFLGALRAVNQYAVGPDGRLVLTTSSGQKLVFH